MMFLNEPSMILHDDTRPTLHGWIPGGYWCRCKCCNKPFSGDKGSFNCADCAYTFNEDLAYEFLWRQVGWQWCIINVARQMGLIKKENKI